MILNDFNMGQLEIICYPDPRLRQWAKSVETINSEIEALVERMSELMIESQGIGLAATQLGVPLQVVIISLTGKRENVEVFINPQLEGLEGSSEMEEGCLSLPGLRGMVPRALSCQVTALDLEGARFCMDMVDLAATVIQHETDHLQGKLFIDRLSTISLMSCRKGLKQLEKEFNQ
ncbi:MAG: peptide deformylase [Planctomycetes bacterium]|nr:peptide deformylase [Planctomycetota bacterium]